MLIKIQFIPSTDAELQKALALIEENAWSKMDIFCENDTEVKLTYTANNKVQNDINVKKNISKLPNILNYDFARHKTEYSFSVIDKEIKELINTALEKNLRKEVKNIFKTFGAEKFKDIPLFRYPDLKFKLEYLLNGKN